MERPVSSSPTDLAPLPKELGPQRDKVMMQNHDRANRFALAEAETAIKDGRFEVKLRLPAKNALDAAERPRLRRHVHGGGVGRRSV